MLGNKNSLPELFWFLFFEDGSKSGHGRRGCLEEGAWDAIHVIQVTLLTYHYQACLMCFKMLPIL